MVLKVTINREIENFVISDVSPSTPVEKMMEVVDGQHIPVASIDLMDKSIKTISGLTPLALAAKSGDLKEIELLAKSCDVNELDKIGQTALAYAAEHGQLEAVKLLIRLGAQVDLFKETVYDELGRLTDLKIEAVTNELLNIDSSPKSHEIEINDASFSPLMLASFYNHREVCKVLVDSGANVNLLTEAGSSALKFACGEGHIEIIYLLIERGADVNAESPLSSAIINGQIEAFKILIENGADATKIDKCENNAFGYTQEIRPKKFKWFANFLQKHSPESLSYYIYSDTVKTLSHSFSIKGTSTYPGNKLISFEREGKYSPGNYQKFANDIKCFCRLFPNLIPQDVEKQLRYSLQLGADINSENVYQMHNRFLQGKPVFVESGWSDSYSGHGVSALLWKDFLFICNRGPIHIRTVELFRLSKEQKEDPDLIRNIKTQPSVEEYKKQIYDNISSKSKRYEIDFDLMDMCSLESQTVGNCSWACIEQSVFVFLVMAAIQCSLVGIDKVHLEKIVKQQKPIFKNFLYFQQVKYLEEYAKLSERGNSIEIDLIKECSLKLRVPDLYPVLEQKVDEVFKSYFPFFHPKIDINLCVNDILSIYLVFCASLNLLFLDLSLQNARVK